MNRKIAVIIVLVWALAFNTDAQKIGYIVSIDEKNTVDSQFFKTQCVETLEKSIYTSTGLKIEVEEVFESDNVFFEYRDNNIHYYVEKKIVERKKSGKMNYQKRTKRISK